MSLSDRDRKLMLAIVPIVLLAAYWFLLLAPKREDASAASKELQKQEQRLADARQQVSAAQGAKTDFAADYGEIVRLGKAIPSGVDMPSLLVQLDRAAAGTGIQFTRIVTGDRTSAAAAAPAPAPATGTGDAASGAAGGTAASGSGDSAQPAAAAGGDKTQTGYGGATESANNAAASQDQNAAQQSGLDAKDTQTSTSSGSGLPIGGAAGTTTGTSAATSPTGLETVPLELEFVGNFFNLADFFHDVKRFVRVANSNVIVGGRLVTIEGVKFSSGGELFPKVRAELKATVYLSPKAQGVTLGATPEGPAATGTQTTPASDSATPDSTTPTPTATATPPGR